MERQEGQPTREDYTECAEIAHEFNELIAVAKLAALLENENNHVLLCRVGVWYWQCGHNTLAAACYRRSLELHAEAATYFNLAVCLDDEAGKVTDESAPGQLARSELVAAATDALRAAHNLYGSAEERTMADESLRANGKGHLVERARAS